MIMFCNTRKMRFFILVQIFIDITLLLVQSNPVPTRSKNVLTANGRTSSSSSSSNHSISMMASTSSSSLNSIQSNEISKTSLLRDLCLGSNSQISTTITHDGQCEYFDQPDFPDFKPEQLKEKWVNVFNKLGYGTYAIVGSPSNFIDDEKLCRDLKRGKNDKFFHQIQFLYVSKAIWDKCGFIKKNLPVNLKELHIIFNQDRHNSGTVLSMIKTWKEIHENLEVFPELKILEIINMNNDHLLHLLLVSKDLKSNERLALMNEVLESGLVDVNHRNSDGNTPLHYCMVPDFVKVSKGKFFDTLNCIQTLMNYKADPNQMNGGLFTPIHLASAFIDKEPLALLLKYNGDVNLCAHEDKLINGIHVGVNSETPIKIALRTIVFRTKLQEKEGIKKFINVLLNTDAFNHLISRDGLQDWKKREESQEYHVKSNHPFYFLLKNPDVDLTIPTGNMGTVLTEAIYFSREDMAMDILNILHLQKSEVIDTPDIHGNTPLMLSLPFFPRLFDKLIENKANVSIKNRAGRNAMNLLFHKNVLPDVQSLKKLLSINLDINSLDNEDGSILQTSVFDLFKRENKESIVRDEHRILDLLKVIVENNINFHHGNLNNRTNIAIMADFLVPDLEEPISSEMNSLRFYILSMIVDKIDFGDRFTKRGEINLIAKHNAHQLYLPVLKFGDAGLLRKLCSKIPSNLLQQFERSANSKENGKTQLFDRIMNLFDHVKGVFQK